jgi:hypothetical protein
MLEFVTITGKRNGPQRWQPNWITLRQDGLRDVPVRLVWYSIVNTQESDIISTQHSDPLQRLELDGFQQEEELG